MRSRRLSVALLGAACAVAGCATQGSSESSSAPLEVTSKVAANFPNDQTIYDFFIDHGFTPVVAAGIVGNFDQESGANPDEVGGLLAQWGGSRLTALISYATSIGAIDPTTGNPTLEAQLEFVLQELPSNGGAAIRAATDLTLSDISQANAAVAFMQDYERCLDDDDPTLWNDIGTCMESKRVGYANTVLAAFGNDSSQTATGGILPSCSATAIMANAPTSAQPFFNIAFDWVNAEVPYAERVTGNPTAGPYRSDCSGFVSAIWGLAAPGETTYMFAPGAAATCGGANADAGKSVSITWDELTPGDALNFPGNVCVGSGHIMLFAGWLNTAHTEFCAVEEYETGHPASITQHSTSEAGTGWGGTGTLATIFDPVRKAGYTPSGSPQAPTAPTCTSGPCRVGLALTADANGYWEAATDGGVFSYGDAVFHGSMGGTKLTQPVVGIAATPTHGGYWLAAADGGVFTFGDARFYGSLGGIALAKPIVGMAATTSGNGYWMVGADGGVFTFGDAGFYGSLGGVSLAKPIVGMAATPSGKGYWMVGSDGGVFTFGDAGFYGSLGSVTLAKPISSIAATASGNGYWLLGEDGGVFTFGDAAFDGSMSGQATPEGQPALVSAAAIVPVPSGGYYVMDSNGGATTLIRSGYCGADIDMPSSPQNVEYVHSSAGTFEVQGAIRTEWDALGGDCSFLGEPRSSESASCVSGGRWNAFAGGNVYWSSATGAHEIHGAILSDFAAHGDECATGHLGFPTTDTVATPCGGGEMQSYQDGAIHYSAATGAHEVYGPIETLYQQHDSECWIGFPTNDTYAVAVGTRTDFQSGYIVHDTATNATTAMGWPATPSCGALTGSPEQGLRSGQTLWSCDGQWALANQTDGNLVLYHQGVAQWATGTTHNGGDNALYMQGDGNLVLYDSSLQPLWSSGTSGHAGAYMALQTDGNIVIYDAGKPVCARFGATCVLPE